MSTFLKIGPSNLAQVSKCPGSAYKKKELAMRRSSFASMDEGTNAHTVIERSTPYIAIRGFNIPESAEELREQVPVVGYFFDHLLGSDCDFGDIHRYFLDVEYLVKTIMQLENSIFLCELGLTPHIDGKIMVDGKADLVVIELKHTARGMEARAVLIDFKFGKGEPVEMDDPHQSKQLYAYAVGVLNFVKYSYDAKLTQICIAVSQPRSVFGAAMSHVVLDQEQILAHQTELRELSDSISDNPDSFVPGKHCKRCPVAIHCPKVRDEEEIRQAALAVISDTATPEQIGYIVNMHAAVVNALEEADLAAYNLMMAGVEVPGLRLALGSKRKAFVNKEMAAKYALDKGLSKDQIYKARPLITPSALEKMLTNLNISTDNVITTIRGKTRVVDANSRDKNTIRLTDITQPTNPTDAAIEMAQSLITQGK